MQQRAAEAPVKGWWTLAWAGRLGGPAAAVGLYLLLPAGQAELTDAGRATAAVGCLMGVLWLTEAMPLPATALLPIVLFPLAGVLSIRDAAAPYAHQYIFLFMGGFMLALAMERWNLHRRIALVTVSATGTSPGRLVGGFMLASAGLSMWISNTATTVMMLPIGLSLIALLADRSGSEDASGAPGPSPAGEEDRREGGEKIEKGQKNFAVCLMLGIAYASSIGGMGTLIGTPPNLFLAGFVKETFAVEISFARWMVVALPLVVVLLAVAWFLLTKVVFPVRLAGVSGTGELIRDELAALGRICRGEWTVLVVFLLTAAAWIAREPLAGSSWIVGHFPAVGRLSDAGIAMAAALALFMIPVDARRGVFALDWKTAQKLPWGVLLLFGGGLSLAAAVKSSELTSWIGSQVAALEYLPLAVLVLLVTLTVTFLTEMTSNTATASAFLPILGGVALGIGVEPMLLLVPAALAASCAFMMPVATPPNAIVFGSGHVTIGQMVKAGLWLNLVAAALITLLGRWAGTWVLTAMPP